MRKKRIGLGILFVILVTVCILGVWRATHSPTTKPATSPQKATSKPMEQLDPLEISAIKQREYTPTAIETSQALGEKGGYSEDVVSFTSDGLKEYALLATPDGVRPDGGYPVIVLLHGYIIPAQYNNLGGYYHDWIASWVKAGYAVVMPDLRGNGKSAGTATSGHYSPEYTYDVMNLLASLKDDGRFNGTRIGVAGHSLGGHLALRVAVVSSDVKATMLANGVVGSMYDLFFNWPHSPAPNDQPTAVVKSQISELIQKHGDPKSNPDFYGKASAVNYVGAISGPVQINHDIDDSTVPFSFSQKLNDALAKDGKNVTFYQYPGDDHQYAAASNHALLLERTTAFWKAHL